MFLEINNLNKSFGPEINRSHVLKDVSFEIEKGEICVILGSSGCGKSTLLNCIGGLEKIDSGSIKVDDQELAGLKQLALGKYRRDKLGFIFQFYNLIPNLNVEENIEVCKYLSKSPIDMEELLDTLDIKQHRSKFPCVLSGGQQQRVAIARAIVKNPELLLCDEPTGALDSTTARDILRLLGTINKKYNTTIIMVTHNKTIADMANRIITMQDGRIKENRVNANPLSADELGDL